MNQEQRIREAVAEEERTCRELNRAERDYNEALKSNDKARIDSARRWFERTIQNHKEAAKELENAEQEGKAE